MNSEGLRERDVMREILACVKSLYILITDMIMHYKGGGVINMTCYKRYSCVLLYVLQLRDSSYLPYHDHTRCH